MRKGWLKHADPVPHPTKHKKLTKTTTKPSVFAMVWDAIQTLGFREILERLAGLSPKVPLSQPFQVCKAECSIPNGILKLSVHFVFQNCFLKSTNISATSNLKEGDTDNF